jgi:hypothetical protein
MAQSDHGEYREEFHAVHAHEYDHNEPKYPLIWAILAVTVIFLVLSGIAIQGYVDGLWTKQTYEKVLSQDNIQLGELRKTEERELTTYGVADPKSGAMRLPIDRAMKDIIGDAAAGQSKYPTAAYAVKTEAELAQGTPGVSAAGAAAVEKSQNQGVASHPNVQPSTVPQQPHK